MYWSEGADKKSGNYHITEYEREFVSQLKQRKPDDCILVNSTWWSDPEKVERMKQWFNASQFKAGECPRILVYSGMDWESTNCVDSCKEAHAFLKDRFEVIHIGNSREEKWGGWNQKSMKKRGRHYFSFWLSFIHKHLDTFYDSCYTEMPNIQKHYMTLNHQPHEHRISFLNDLYTMGLFKDTIVSAIKPHEDYIFENPIILKENRPPHIMDKSFEWERLSDTHLANDIISLGEPQYWNKHFCTVVTESVMHSDVFISEKTFKPLIGLRPFIIIGDRHLYTKLKEWKFDTFEDLFPNIHRDEPDKYRRIDNALKDMHGFQFNHGLDELNNLYAKLEDRLMYNRKRVLEVINENYNDIMEINKL